MREQHEAINGLWVVFKKHLDKPPHTLVDWQTTSDDFIQYCGVDPFKTELAVACYRELMRLDGQTVTAERGWMNG
jgi:hypothetical protein